MKEWLNWLTLVLGSWEMKEWLYWLSSALGHRVNDMKELIYRITFALEVGPAWDERMDMPINSCIWKLDVWDEWQ